MTMGLRLMMGMVVLVFSMLVDVLMVVIMGLGISTMGMLMAVFVKVFMSMSVRMLVAMFHISMHMFMQMDMRVIVRMQMLVFVLTFHIQTLLHGVDYFASGSHHFLKPSPRSVNEPAFRLDQSVSLSLIHQRGWLYEVFEF
jgi:hypothetical protein